MPEASPLLTFEKGRFVLKDLTPKIRTALKHNAHWKSVDAGENYATISLGAAAALRSYADRLVEKIFTRTFQAHYDLPRLPRLANLDLHQRAGLEWVLRRKRSYLAHAPGAGKTAQAILAGALARGEGQCLFIVPPSLVANWEREIRKVTEWIDLWPATGIVPLSAKQDDMAWRADFIICPDSLLTRDWVYSELRAMRKKLIAVDEASRFKESTSERSIAFYGGRLGEVVYPGLFRDARHVVFLDGSPAPSRAMDLWAPTYALHPQAIDCMTRDEFGYRYCGARPNERGEWVFTGSSREDELREKLRDDFMHVVAEGDLSHPERRRTILFMNQDYRSAEHREWERRHLTGETELNEDANQGELARFRKELGVRKIEWTARYVAERLRDKNESILLFAWHREVCEGLYDALSKWRPGLVMGGTRPDIREDSFKQFQSGEKKLLIMNVAAGGRGHNLQRADRVIFAEFSWSDETNVQAEKRASRRGNERAFTRCEYVVSPGSIDERVMSSVFRKQKMGEKLFR